MKQNYNQNVFPSFKKLLLTGMLLAFASGINAQISTFPWTETFEDASPTRGAWTQINEVNAMAWTFATAPSTGGYIGAQPASAAAYQGSKMANYPATSHNFDKTKLVSPVLNLSNMTNVTVSFYFRNPFWSPDQNWLRIFYRTSAAAPWVQVSEFHSNVPSWISSGTIALPNPSATYQIAVECETDYGYSTVVDSLVVNATSLAVNEFSTNLISYYPNPTATVLNFSSNEMISDISVYNVLGQKVMTAKVNANEGQIDLSDLTNGTYIVEGTTEAGPEIFKVVKK